MMRNVVLILLFAGVTFSLSAQPYNNVKPVEFEIGVGVNKGGTIDGAIAEPGLQFFIETRHNISNSPLDIGFQAMLSGFSRNENSYGIDHSITHRALLTTLMDYNFRYWNRVAPFVGFGVGFAAVSNDTSWVNARGRREYEAIFDRSFVVNPRVGVEFFDHLRVTLEYKLMRKEYSFFGINVGFAFGGGYRY